MAGVAGVATLAAVTWREGQPACREGHLRLLTLGSSLRLEKVDGYHCGGGNELWTVLWVSSCMPRWDYCRISRFHPSARGDANQNLPYLSRLDLEPTREQRCPSSEWSYEFHPPAVSIGSLNTGRGAVSYPRDSSVDPITPSSTLDAIRNRRPAALSVRPRLARCGSPRLSRNSSVGLAIPSNRGHMWVLGAPMLPRAPPAASRPPGGRTRRGPGCSSRD
jgi:hypothetical protein